MSATELHTELRGILSGLKARVSRLERHLGVKVNGIDVESYLYEKLDSVWNNVFQHFKSVPESQLEDKHPFLWKSAVNDFVPYLLNLKDKLEKGSLYGLYHGNSHHRLLKAAAKEADMLYVLDSRC